MGAGVGCVVTASDVTTEAVKDLVARLGVTALAVRGTMDLPGSKAKAPVSPVDGSLPGLQLAGDDADLGPALDAARGAGVDPYVVLANPLVGVPDWTGLLAKDSHGRSATEIDAEHPSLCPNNEKLIKWLAAAAAEIVKAYRPAGVLLHDFSLGPPCKLDALFLCWCDVCETRIAELGYDADRIRVGILGARSRLEEAKLTAAAFSGCGAGQFIEAVGYDTGLLDWLNFRADCVSSLLYEVRQAAAGAGGGVCTTVVSKAPTVSMLAGQRRADLLRDTTLADVYAPVICGPGSGVLQTIAGHSDVIRSAMDGADQADAMALSAKLHGYAGLPLPASADEAVNSPSAELLVASAQHELELTMAAGGDVPRWPAIDVAGLPADVVGDVAKLIADSGADGIFYIGVPS